MSQMPPADQAGAQGQPSEEQLRAMLAQMRVEPVDSMIAQVMQLLLEGVQVKLGRQDGRFLLDTLVVLVDQVRAQASPDLIGQVDEAVAQLRLAQVQAEAEVQAAAAQTGQTEPNDLAGPASGTGPVDSAPPGAAPGTPAPGSGASRLWTPGT